MDTALLIIDVQQALSSGEYAAFESRRVISRINHVSHLARNAGAAGRASSPRDHEARHLRVSERVLRRHDHPTSTCLGVSSDPRRRRSLDYGQRRPQGRTDLGTPQRNVGEHRQFWAEGRGSPRLPGTYRGVTCRGERGPARDLERFLAEYSDDIRIFRPPTAEPVISGKAALAEYYAANRFNLPKLHADVVNRMILGNKVVDHERIAGVRDTSFDVAAVYEVIDGRIRSVWFFSADR